MIRFRMLAVAFLFEKNSLLLMERSPQASLFPGQWVPIGGHLEVSEIATPHDACLREIAEETGLSPKDVDDLSLRYIMHRMRDDEIRTQYVYFGHARSRHVQGNEEGKLYWVPLTDVLDLDMSATTRFIFQHYMEIGINSQSTFIGALEGRSGAPTVNWIPISDWQ